MKAVERMREKGKKVGCREIREIPMEQMAGLEIPRPAFSPLEIGETEVIIGRKIPSWEKGLAEYLDEIGL